MNKRLYKTPYEKKIAGVCGGIAEYFDVDPTLVRLGWIIAAFCAGGGLIAYIIAMIVIPDKPSTDIQN